MTDQAGNVASTSWSVLYSPSYLAANEPVAHASLAGFSARAVGATVSRAVQSALVQAAGTTLGPVTLEDLAFGSPSVAVTLAQGGVRTTIDIPTLDITAAVGGATFEIILSNVAIDSTLMVTVANGAFVVSMPATPAITLSNVKRARGLVKGLIAPALAVALQTALPPALETALNDARGP